MDPSSCFLKKNPPFKGLPSKYIYKKSFPLPFLLGEWLLRLLALPPEEDGLLLLARLVEGRPGDAGRPSWLERPAASETKKFRRF